MAGHCGLVGLLCKGSRYLGLAAETTEELVAVESALLVGNDARHAVHQARLGLLVQTQRVVRQHAGQQRRRLVHPSLLARLIRR